MRAARAEGELADAVERIAELESELEVFQESEASHYAKEKEMGTCVAAPPWFCPKAQFAFLSCTHLGEDHLPIICLNTGYA